MTFEEFFKVCNFDISDGYAQSKTQVLVIFSSGFRDEYSKEFVEANEEVAKKLTAKKLYDYLKEHFNE